MPTQATPSPLPQLNPHYPVCTLLTQYCNQDHLTIPSFRSIQCDNREKNIPAILMGIDTDCFFMIFFLSRISSVEPSIFHRIVSSHTTLDHRGPIIAIYYWVISIYSSDRGMLLLATVVHT